MSSASLASSSKPAAVAKKPARVVVEQEEAEDKEERLSDLDNEAGSMGEDDGDDFSEDDDGGQMGDEFDLGGGQRDGVEDYDTDDEIERVANDKQPEKSKKTASEYIFRSLWVVLAVVLAPREVDGGRASEEKEVVSSS